MTPTDYLENIFDFAQIVQFMCDFYVYVNIPFLVIGLVEPAPPEPETEIRQDSSSCSTPDDSTSDYFSMTHSRQSSILPGLDELLEEEEEEEEEESGVALTTSPLRSHLAAMLASLQSQQWLRSVPHSWQG